MIDESKVLVILKQIRCLQTERAAVKKEGQSLDQALRVYREALDDVDRQLKEKQVELEVMIRWPETCE